MQTTRGHLMRRRGFTLIEVMIVVAIIGIVVALSIFGIQRSRESISLDRASAQVRSAIEEARSLAALAGSRAGTPRLIEDGSCGWVAGNLMEVTIDPAGTVTYPSEVTFDGTTMTVQCETWNLADVITAGSAGTFVQPAAITRFAFSPTGRLIPNPAYAPGSVFVQITSPTEPTNTGFRVLTSGIMCQASDPAPPPGGECDDSPNW